MAKILRYHCVGIVSLRYRFMFKKRASGVREVEIHIPIIRNFDFNFTLGLNYDKITGFGLWAFDWGKTFFE